ncbi:MAG TPA: hypothetical protein DEF85_07665 [Clostridiaceae bacterium]|jgi:hypothetical protein|nr:hypothetical protein [Clostridiaceae bacterium]
MIKNNAVISLALCVALVFCFTTSVYAAGDNSDDIRVKAIISGLKVEGKELLEPEVSLLLEKGFTEEEIKILDFDIRKVANLIVTRNMSTDEIEILKNGFVNDRPKDPEITSRNQVGKSLEEVNMPDTLSYKYDLSNSINATDTGVHLALFTQPSYKFYEYTGFANFGSVYAYTSNTRPYVMFGAHGTTGSIDAGVVYYKEHNAWRVFMSNGQPNGWYDGIYEANISKGSNIYLNLRCAGNYVQIIVRDASTWSIIDEQSVYMGSSFTTNPTNLELVRENTLAQTNRVDDGSYLRNVRWSDVYLYSLTQTTPAAMSHMKSSRSGFYVYSGRYMYGETPSANQYISASGLNYNGETSSLEY